MPGTDRDGIGGLVEEQANGNLRDGLRFAFGLAGELLLQRMGRQPGRLAVYSSMVPLGDEEFVAGARLAVERIVVTGDLDETQRVRGDGDGAQVRCALAP